MILSTVEIQRALDEGLIEIDPEPLPRTPDRAGTACPYQTTSVDLSLADEVSYFRNDLAVNVDLRRGRFADLFGPNSATHTLTEDQPYVLRPGKLVLARTRERVHLPIREGKRVLAARVEGRSSYARCGLLVHFTAPTIYAGFHGTITLELINLGSLSISLYPGAPICQLILEEVSGTPFTNPGQFQGQTRSGGSRG